MGMWGGGSSSLFLTTDEERGKKDDDHKLAKKKAVARRGWNPARVQPRRGARRLLIVVLLGCLVYLFIKYIPTDLPIRDRRRPVYSHPKPAPFLINDHVKPRPPAPHDQPTRRPATDTSSDEASAVSQPAQDYNGPVLFSSLAPTLHSIGDTRGAFTVNRNVLFAAASLKSVSRLLPVACQMSAQLRSYVHFALMSRSEIPMDELKAVNGVDESCVVFFHDARPDNSSISTEARLEYGVARAMYSINNFMHPQAVIIDGSDVEEPFFLRAMRVETPELGTTLVELPAGSFGRLKWMTKLDSASLKAWNDVNVDILIQAQPGASGSLVRLLKSLAAADYSGCSIPHLTVELPHEVDDFTQQFIEGFTWPPPQVASPKGARLLSVRHRVHQRRPTIEESVIRFLESYWPNNPANSHVLVLSPQVELSPHFYHYLKYTVLEYRHSNPAVFQEWGTKLLGISLELPSTYIDGTKGFVSPSKRKSAQTSSAAMTTTTTSSRGSFLWQAPNSNAALYMGDKWVELHSYVSQLLAAQSAWRNLPPVIGERHAGRAYPAWLEHAVKLSLARGYSMLYPGPDTASNLATVHGELYQPPEEYGGSAGRNKAPESPEVQLAPTDLLDSLPDGGELPHITDLPALAWDGERTTLESLHTAALDYADTFRLSTGCDLTDSRATRPDKLARDLFCGGGG